MRLICARCGDSSDVTRVTLHENSHGVRTVVDGFTVGEFEWSAVALCDECASDEGMKR